VSRQSQQDGVGGTLEREPFEAIASGLLRGQTSAVGVATEWVRSVVRHQAWGFAAPEDIVQDALLAVVGNLREDRYRSGDFRAYVRRIAKNICIGHYRRHRRRGPHESLEADDARVMAGDGDEQAMEARTEVRQILAGLDGSCRRLISLAYLEGLSRRQIGQRLGISETAAKVRLFRCLERARHLGRPPAGRASPAF
jgi:RNA polymerase sigma-70 factor (ECF subfamily)